jgi:hypothetical protein
MSVAKPCIFENMEVFMNDQKFSDIEVFPHSRKGRPLFITGHKNVLHADYSMGSVSSVIRT